MATKKLPITVGLSVLLFLFTLANSRAPLDLPVNDVTTLEGLTSLPEPDTENINTILLPSEKPETEPATVVELEPDTTEPKLPEPEITTTTSSSEDEPVEFEETTETQTAEPLTVISFRPINRHHFPRRLPFPRHRHGCHHHHRQFKPWGPRPRPDGREFSYENDMIQERQWTGRFQGRDGPRHWVVPGDDLASWRNQDEMRMFRPHHRFHRHHHHHDDDGDLEEKEERHPEEDGGIFKGIRKFLNRF